MKTTFPIPAYAITCWADPRDIIVVTPTSDGGQYFQRFPLTEGGLSKALAVMRDLRVKNTVITGDYPIALPKPRPRPLKDVPDDFADVIDEIMKNSGI